MSTSIFDVVPVRGRYGVHKARGRRGGACLHQTFTEAEIEALRLAERDPEQTFVITQEVARVHLAPRKRIA